MKYWQKWITKYRVFFFDLDGTLVDSNKLHAKAFQSVIKSMSGNIRFNYDDYKGMKTSEVFNILGYEKKNITDLTKIKQLNYRDYIKKGKVEIFPYVCELLKSITLKGYKAYLVTGSSYKTVEMILKYSNIGLYINEFVCGDETERSKPEPDIYHRALKKFNYKSNDVIAVEDSYNGILSAVNAGIKTISIDKKCDHNLVQYSTFQAMYDFLNIDLPGKLYSNRWENKGEYSENC